MSVDFTAAEQGYMHRALHLARRGQGRVEPNPMVGCVLVKGGRILAEGYHRRYGGAHAEVEALQRAGRTASGSTAYVTLEPCCHYGKTPPCTEALIAARIARVVAAVPDPYPAVNGGGFRRLRQAGIRVDVGLLEIQAGELNAPFITRVTRRRPYVILKWAQSLDGKIATRTGDSRWISSPPSRRIVHRLRARVDGILVGVQTVLADNPRLDAREVPVRRVAVRVVLDSRLRIPLDATVVATAHQVPTLILTTGAGLLRRSAKAEQLHRAGVAIAVGQARDGRVALPAALRALAKQGFTNLLVEGGGAVLGAFLDQGLADEAFVFVSPRFIGGDDAISAYRGTGVADLRGAPLRPAFTLTRVGPDLLYHLRFRDPCPEANAGYP